MFILLTVLSALLPYVLAQGTNSPPRFSHAMYQTSCMENIDVDSIIYQFDATDPDSGPNGDLVYTMEENPWFKINRTGCLKVKSVIDADRASLREVLTYVVTVSDRGSPPMSDTTLVSIYINDTNEHRPDFVKDLYYAKMTDGDPPGKLLAVVNATDKDRDSVLIYNFLVPEMFLEIDNRTGEIYNKHDIVLGDIVVEKGSTNFYVNIRADDGLYIEQARLMVSVVDRNNFPPDFNPVSYNVTVRENVSGVTLVTVQATDQRETPHQQVRYSLLHQNNTGALSIDSVSGAITLEQALDREGQAGDGFTQYVLAKDDGNPEPVMTSTATLLITVTDVNDNPPQFNIASYNLFIPQTFSSGQQFPLPTATDPDLGSNSVIEYLVTSGGAGHFQVDRSSNILKTATACGTDCLRTVNCLYRQITVRAFHPDVPSHRDTLPVNIILTRPDFTGSISNITGLLDCSKAPHPNNNAPQFPRDSYDATVYENVTRNTVVLTLSARDGDLGLSGKVKYSLDSPYFAINDSGHIVTTADLDYESLADKRICFQVKATDMGTPSKSGTTQVCVTVENINEHRPKFGSRRYNATVRHGDRQGTSLVTISATDKDAEGDLRYEIVNPNKYIQIDERTGQVSLAKTANMTELLRGAGDDQILLTVSVTDGEFYDYTILKVLLERSNDHSPRFSRNLYQVTVDEELSPVVLVTVSADDADTPKQTLNFDIITKPTQGTFFINPKSGEITLISKLDKEQLSGEYLDMVVMVTDNGQPPPMRSATATVRVLVRDINDHPPRFLVDIYDLQIPQNYTAGLRFPLPQASDDDANAVMRYNLSENAKHMFDIDEGTGEVTLKQSCGKSCARVEDCLYMTFTVWVYNPDRPEMKDSLTVNMTLISLFQSDKPSDVLPCDSVPKPNNAPRFLLNSYQASFFETVVTGSSVLVVSAVDSDPGQEGRLEFILRGSRDFNITQTGHIYTLRNMDYEKPADRKSCMTVVARDNGVPRLESTAPVCLIVKDTNDNAPQFSENPYFTTVLDEAPEGQVLTEILATDADQHSSITYRFHVLTRYFRLDGRNVTVSTRIDRADILKTSPNSLVELTVVASDGTHEGRSTLYVAVLPLDISCPGVASGSSTMIGLFIAAWILTVIIAIIIICCYRKRNKEEQKPKRGDSVSSSIYSNKTSKSDLVRDNSLYMNATLTLPRGAHSEDISRFYHPLPSGKGV